MPYKIGMYGFLAESAGVPVLELALKHVMRPDQLRPIFLTHLVDSLQIPGQYYDKSEG